MKWESWQLLAHNPTYWQNSAEKGLLKAEYLGDYTLRLWFEEDLDVSIYDLDFYPLLIEEDPGPALRPLRQIERFQFVKGDYALVWPNPETGAYDKATIDLAPECVRFFCEQYGRLVKPSRTALKGGVLG
ncbi:hypothetical protein GFS31_39890 [Leptolyngbya sp. BL0902]|uniref:hypothetical protein n=1 Tax=Leptolyngbya sp. BL0902 TaxID=1115757 RepID=UPI0018E6E781|nr:hypothetical protein [Leptolyngbya sp. BL0902]QQE67276.1 hypothetical protein GFS31_39890 [Leptolyngbya sp. BL0902]